MDLNKNTIQQWGWIALAVFLLFPAFLWNLGLHPFLEDEAIRATVAMEMCFTGDYINTTTAGDPYFSKPPLFNWLLILGYTVTGEISEYNTRLVSVIALLLFGFSISKVFQRTGLSKKNSIILGLMFLTSGRILMWESMWGLIDITFSWIMFLMIYMIYTCKNSRWFYLIPVLGFLGFLMKGFPSLIFYVLSYAILWWIEAFAKKVLMHLTLGSAIIMLLVCGFYWGSGTMLISESTAELWNQAAQRTLIKKDAGSLVLHVLTFPLAVTYHFLPWSLLALVFLKRNVRRRIYEAPVMKYLLAAFLLNISVYWISPGFYPRYILMLMPFLFGLSIMGVEKETRLSSIVFKILDGMVVTLLLLTIYGLWLIRAESLFSIPLVMTVVVFFALGIAYFYNRYQRFEMLICLLLIFRIGMNQTAIPIRAQDDEAAFAKSETTRIIEYHGQEIKLYSDSEIDRTGAFYLQQGMQQQLSRSTTGRLMLLDKERYQIPQNYVIIDSLFRRRGETYLYLIQKRN